MEEVRDAFTRHVEGAGCLSPPCGTRRAQAAAFFLFGGADDEPLGMVASTLLVSRSDGVSVWACCPEYLGNQPHEASSP